MNNIDVAKIMADITCDVEKRYSEAAIKEREGISNTDTELNELRTELLRLSGDIMNMNGQLCHGIKERNHILAGEVQKIHSLEGIPWRIPKFEWKNKMIRGPVRFAAKTVSKLARFITIQQNDVNETMTRSLELLQASTLSMADWSREVEERLRILMDAVDHMIIQLKKYHDLTEVDMTDAMYRDLEKLFWESGKEIEKQKYYLDHYVRDRVSAEAEGMVVDLGCGRGEWLKTLRENGYNGIGVDRNEEFLKACSVNGIKTVRMDVLAYLKTLPAESVKLLTAFQLIEHLSTNQIMELFGEMARVLRKGGMIILETPNPVNVKVGAASFYIDPTHKRQIHPKFLEFLTVEYGFTDVETTCWQQEDYAMIARK